MNTEKTLSSDYEKDILELTTSFLTNSAPSSKVVDSLTKTMLVDAISMAQYHEVILEVIKAFIAGWKSPSFDFFVSISMLNLTNSCIKKLLDAGFSVYSPKPQCDNYYISISPNDNKAGTYYFYDTSANEYLEKKDF